MKKPANIPRRPLGLIMNAVESCGLDVSHVHDEIVFTSDNVLLLRMNDKSPELVSLYFNQDCDPSVAEKLDIKLTASALEEGLKFVNEGTYFLNQADKNNIEIQFSQK